MSHANGAATMRALAQSSDAFPLGFTQRSEIVCAPGILLGDSLPGSFALRTTYAIAIGNRPNELPAARKFVSFLTTAGQVELREMFGFRPPE
jgi:hypothetical protein